MLLYSYYYTVFSSCFRKSYIHFKIKTQSEEADTGAKFSPQHVFYAIIGIINKMCVKCCSSRMLFFWTVLAGLLFTGSMLLAFWGIPRIIHAQIHSVSVRFVCILWFTRGIFTPENRIGRRHGTVGAFS